MGFATCEGGVIHSLITTKQIKPTQKARNRKTRKPENQKPKNHGSL